MINVMHSWPIYDIRRYILSRVLTNQMIDHHIWMTTLVLSLLRIQTKMVITKSHVGPATKHYTLEQNGRGSMQRWWNDGGRTQWRERRRLRSSLWWMVILLHMPLWISILLRTAVVVKTWICRVANVKRAYVYLHVTNVIFSCAQGLLKVYLPLVD